MNDSLHKSDFRDIQIERQNGTFEFASVNDYIKHLKDVAAPLKALLDNEPERKQEIIWKVVVAEVKSNYTNTADGSVRLNNTCICFVGNK